MNHLILLLDNSGGANTLINELAGSVGGLLFSQEPYRDHLLEVSIYLLGESVDQVGHRRMLSDLPSFAPHRWNPAGRNALKDRLGELLGGYDQHPGDAPIFALVLTGPDTESYRFGSRELKKALEELDGEQLALTTSADASELAVELGFEPYEVPPTSAGVRDGFAELSDKVLIARGLKIIETPPGGFEERMSKVDDDDSVEAFSGEESYTNRPVN